MTFSWNENINVAPNSALNLFKGFLPGPKRLPSFYFILRVLKAFFQNSVSSFFELYCLRWRLLLSNCFQFHFSPQSETLLVVCISNAKRPKGSTTIMMSSLDLGWNVYKESQGGCRDGGTLKEKIQKTCTQRTRVPSHVQPILE